MRHAEIRKFSPGFRLSSLDLVILAAGCVAALAAGRVDRCFGVAIAFVVGHFFLFCNVLRMSRAPELIWAGAFVALATAAVAQAVRWPAVFIVSATLTLALAAFESRRPCYHGVGWRRLNPRLPDWWAGQAGQ